MAYYTPVQLYAIEEAVAERHEELVELLGIRVRQAAHMYYGACAVHSGRRSTSFNYYTEGNVRKGNWVCWSHHCEHVFKPTTIGFARGVWSNKECNWRQLGDPTYPFPETVDRLCKCLQINPQDVAARSADLEKRRVVAQSNFFKPATHKHGIWVPKQLVRQHLIIPSPYFINRGIPASVLEQFDVGDYKHNSGEFAGRAVVPVYDDAGATAIGFTGRSIYPQCSKCSLWHNLDFPCPKTDIDRLGCSKWRNATKFSKTHCLYNLNQKTAESGDIILVEGPKDVWVRYANGQKNAVALFGLDIADPQVSKLISSGVMSVRLAMDDDGPGREAAIKLKQRLSRSFKVEVLL